MLRGVVYMMKSRGPRTEPWGRKNAIQNKKHACKAGVYTPARVAGNKYVVGIDGLIGRNFFKSNARVVLEVSESVSDRRHLIDS